MALIRRIQSVLREWEQNQGQGVTEEPQRREDEEEQSERAPKVQHALLMLSRMNWTDLHSISKEDLLGVCSVIDVARKGKSQKIWQFISLSLIARE